MSYDAFTDLAAELIAAGLPIPNPLKDAIGGAFTPLSLDTRESGPGGPASADTAKARPRRSCGRSQGAPASPSYLEALSSDFSGASTSTD
jgi:hypothetical protein